MKKKILLIVILLVVLGGAIYLISSKSQVKIINIYEHEKLETDEIDLDSDGVKEKIDFQKEGTEIVINNKKLLVNKHYEQVTEDWAVCNANYYYVLDLNNDEILEIIHRTFNGMVSPGTNKYTIYNYKDGELKEVGALSIIGSIPEEIKVAGNKITFTYIPFEANFSEREVIKLKVD